MSSNRLLTCYRQSSSHPLAGESPDHLGLPSTEPAVWSRRPAAFPLAPHPVNLLTLPPEELFDTLVFNPERVYGDLTTLVPTNLAGRNEPEKRRARAPNNGTLEDCNVRKITKKATQEWSQPPAITHPRPSRTTSDNGRELKQDNMSLVSHLKKEIGTLIVSKRRGRSSKKSAAKGKVKAGENSSKKRAAGKDVNSNERASKAPRIEPKANIGKKVGNSGTIVQTIDTSHEVIEISDTEEEIDEKPADHKKDPVMLQHRMKSWQPHNKVLAPSVLQGNIDHAPTWSFPIADCPDTKPDLTSNRAAVVEANEVVGSELQKVRQELQLAHDIIRKMQQEIEKRDADALLEMQKQETKAKREVAVLLEAARQDVCIVAELREQLQNSQVVATQLREQLRDSQDALSQQKHEHQALQVRCGQEAEYHRKEQQRHEGVLNDILKSKAEQKEFQEQVQTLQTDKLRLFAEVEALKAATQSARSFSTLSPVPSLSLFASEERREHNVRKMYIKTKRQYDILHSIANDLATCTRSMDLGSFGEFGKYLRKLRVSLDLEDGVRDRQAPMVRRPDDDDEEGTERSSE